MAGSLADSMLESPLDLSMAAVSEPGPGLIAVATRMSAGRLALAAIFGAVALLFLVSMRRPRAEPLWTRATAGGTPARVIRRYLVRAALTPALSFTVANDREAARSLARSLSAALGYRLDDRVEDDGIERRPAGTGADE